MRPKQHARGGDDETNSDGRPGKTGDAENRLQRPPKFFAQFPYVAPGSALVITKKRSRLWSVWCSTKWLGVRKTNAFWCKAPKAHQKVRHRRKGALQFAELTATTLPLLNFVSNTHTNPLRLEHPTTLHFRTERNLIFRPKMLLLPPFVVTFFCGLPSLGGEFCASRNKKMFLVALRDSGELASVFGLFSSSVEKSLEGLFACHGGSVFARLTQHRHTTTQYHHHAKYHQFSWSDAKTQTPTRRGACANLKNKPSANFAVSLKCVWRNCSGSKIKFPTRAEREQCEKAFLNHCVTYDIFFHACTECAISFVTSTTDELRAMF